MEQVNSYTSQMARAAATPLVSVSSGDGIAQKLSAGGQSVQDFINQHGEAIAIGATALGLGGIAAGVTGYVRSRKKATRRKSSGSGGKRRAKRQAGARRRVGSRPRKATKRRNKRGGAVKDRYKGKKVYRTKRGQPYVLMANGKARFVKA